MIDIKIEGDTKEIKELLRVPKDMTLTRCLLDRNELLINGVTFYVTGLESSYGSSHWWEPYSKEINRITLSKVILPKTKSSEEITAEEAVAKARESLKAAKKTLKKIQEKKNERT